MNEEKTPSKAAIRTGYVLTTLPALMLLMSAGMKLAKPPAAVEGLQKFGFNESILIPLGILELVCTLLYCIPRTSVLGAILLTGYLGGAVVTHLRMGEPFIAPVIIGIVLWGGIYLRDPRLRALIPFKS